MKELILVTGSDGLVGSRFVELFPKKELLYTPSEKEMDITNSDAVKKVFAKYPIATVVHFAAYTDVAGRNHENPCSYVHFYNQLSYLQSLGLIMMLSTKVKRTYANRITLLCNPEIIRGAYKIRFG